MCRDGLWLTEHQETNSTNNYTQTLTSSPHKHYISVSKLKTSLKQKDSDWNKLLSRISRVDPQFPSVYRRIENFRAKMEEK
jgi:hypothetical protein